MNKSDISTELWEITRTCFAPRPNVIVDAKAIHDFKVAERLSTMTDRKAGPKYHPWADLRPEMDVRYTTEAGKEFPLKKRNFLPDLRIMITAFYTFDLESKLGKIVIGSVPVERVAEDFGILYMYALATVDNGKSERLYEDMFLAYQSGGWPCGWYGKYPEGQLVVFYPS